MPLASRIVARSHLQEVNREGMKRYLDHHLKIAGLKQSPFDSQAITAIYQGSGGLFRKANHLARGVLVAAAGGKSQVVKKSATCKKLTGNHWELLGKICADCVFNIKLLKTLTVLN